jgi:hypothetical protein
MKPNHMPPAGTLSRRQWLAAAATAAGTCAATSAATSAAWAAASPAAAAPPELLLARPAEADIDPAGWLVSEKFDYRETLVRLGTCALTCPLTMPT